jgi:hypothetical protein
MDGDEEPRPGNFDRAWNDPPLFNYKANAQPPTNGSKLNKRVNYPATTGKQNLSFKGQLHTTHFLPVRS